MVSEDVVQSLKNNYGGKFESLDNHDLVGCLHLLEKHSYVSDNKLQIIEDFVAPKSNNEELINMATASFKASCSVKVSQEEKLLGRNDEISKINKKLESKDSSAINLRGSSGIGKTKLAREICSQWRGIYRVFDLREAKDMKAIYYNMLHNLEVPIPGGYIDQDREYVVTKIKEKVTDCQSIPGGHAVLFILDNVNRFTTGKGKEGRS